MLYVEVCNSGVAFEVAFIHAYGRAALQRLRAVKTLLDVPASTLSFHLKELMHAGLVDVERDGRSLIYRPALARMNALLGYLTDHCCQGQACAPAARRSRTTC